VRAAYQLLADEDEAVRKGAAGLVVQMLEEAGAEAQALAEREAAKVRSPAGLQGARTLVTSALACCCLFSCHLTVHVALFVPQAAAAAAKRGRGAAGKKGPKSPAPANGGPGEGASGSGIGGDSKESAQLEGLLLMMGRLAVGEVGCDLLHWDASPRRIPSLLTAA
jgi:hypothetical protein